MSVAQRWDRLPGGMNIWWDTFQFFWGKPTDYKWKFLGTKKLFAAHNPSTEPQMIKGKLLCGVDQYSQILDVIMLEGTPKPNIQAPVSRFVLYVDPITYTAYHGIYYDKRGREWVIYYFFTGCNKEWMRYNINMGLYDVQRQYGSNGYLRDMRKDVDFLNPEFFGMDNLKRHFGGR